MVGYKWSSFANQHALITVAMMILGGIISIIGAFKWWPIGIYSIIIGVIVGILEYPRSAKPNSSSSIPRPYQYIFSKLFSRLGILYTDYFPRFVLYFTLSIPILLTLSTIIPAFNLLIVSGLYLTSKIKKEKWILIEPKQEAYKQVTVIVTPERPPPRAFGEFQSDNEKTKNQAVAN